MDAKKVVLRVDLLDDRRVSKAFKALASLSGIESIAVDKKYGRIIVVGFVDPVDVVYKLRKIFATEIVSVGPAREEKKYDSEKKDDKKEDYRKEELITFELVNRITNNFSEDRIIGRGRYGAIYKGVRDDGRCIAVMKLFHLKPVLEKEYQIEISNIAWVSHPNTIQFVGYCYHIAQVSVEHQGEQVYASVNERFLCFEYVQGPSLDEHLSNEPCGLHWHTCYAIIRGICMGLHYLHKGPEHRTFYPRHMGPEHPPLYHSHMGPGHPTSYHLDLKPTNILLDRYMVPKIGGFGLSRIFASLGTNDTSEDTKTSVYMPPEYFNGQEISPKFDVFSLGVIIIQMMAGKESYSKCADTSPEEFIEIVHQLWEKRTPEAIWRHASSEVRECIEIALKCVKFDRVMRPTITEIVDKLRFNKIYLNADQLYYRTTREFTLNFLKGITNDFSVENIVGQGGYGVVYKGILDNGEEIAIKKLHPMSCIYEEHQFKKELNNLTKAQHKNIVLLVGYCHHIEQILVEHEGQLRCAYMDQRALCLEYMQGGSLDKYISDDEACKLDWVMCYKIIKGICEGLQYLHKQLIFHLDLKPENILLDKDMMPKIGDFGLSRLFDSMQTHRTQSHDVRGTRGYMPPEYVNGGQTISRKFDIFSLGVIIIQIMAGKKGYYDSADTSPEEFVELVHRNWLERLRTTTVSCHASQEVRACIKIALRCKETDRVQRPTIDEIVNELNNIGATSQAIDAAESRSSEIILDPSTSSSKQQDRTQPDDNASSKASASSGCCWCR